MFGILVSKKLFCSSKRYEKKQESKNDLIPQLLQHTHTHTNLRSNIKSNEYFRSKTKMKNKFLLIDFNSTRLNNRNNSRLYIYATNDVNDAYECEISNFDHESNRNEIYITCLSAEIT